MVRAEGGLEVLVRDRSHPVLVPFSPWLLAGVGNRSSTREPVESVAAASLEAQTQWWGLQGGLSPFPPLGWELSVDPLRMIQLAYFLPSQWQYPFNCPSALHSTSRFLWQLRVPSRPRQAGCVQGVA